MSQTGRDILICGPVATRDGGKASGGIAAHVSDVAPALAERGWSVTVYADNVTPSRSPLRTTSWGTLYGPPNLKRALVLSLTRAHCAKAVIGALRSLSTARRMGLTARGVIAHAVGLADAAHLSEPDVVHLHQPELRPFLARLAGVSAVSVLTMHSLSTLLEPERAEMNRQALLGIREARTVIAVSEDVAEGVAAAVPGTCPVVLPNGIDLSLFRDPPATVEVEHRPGLLYVGRLMANKGPQDAIRALVAVRERFSGATLYLIGPTQDVDPAAEAASAGLPPGAVVTLGDRDTAEVAAWLHACDVLVMPSRVREGHGRVLLEAMAARTPIVASAVGAVPTVLAHGELGAVVSPASPDALAEQVIRVLEGGEEIDSMVQRAAEHVESQGLGAMVDRLEALYLDAQ